MAQVKISELDTLAQQLQNSDYVPMIHNGVTYKFAPFNYLVKNSGDEIIAGIKTFSSSPIVPYGGSGQQAAPMAYVNPVSDIGRLTEISGDGIPTIPDGIAVQRINYFTSVPSGWSTNVTPTSSFSGGVWHISGGASAGYYINLSNNMIRIRLRVISGSAYIGYNGTITDSNRLWHYADVGVSSGAFVVYCADASSVFEISDIYIGSGEYATPLHDKSNNIRWKNYGLLPVDGVRGKGLLAQGAQYAVADSPVIGTTGTLAIRFSRNSLGTDQWFFENASAVSNGILVRFDTSNNLLATVSNGTTLVTYTLGTISDYAIHTLALRLGGIAYLDGANTGVTVPTIAAAGLLNAVFLRAGGASAYFFNGVIHDFRVDSRVWTDAECLSWHNDPKSVDSTDRVTINGGSATATDKTILLKQDTAANWASVNPVLHQGEKGLETDTGKEKTGDGVTAWNSLGYICNKRGTFTPSFAFGGIVSGTYTEQRGDYRVNDDIVYFTIHLFATSFGSATGSLTIKGLPFTSKTGYVYCSCCIGYFSGISSQYQLSAFIYNNSSEVAIFYRDTAGNMYRITDSNMTGSGELILSGSYLIE